MRTSLGRIELMFYFAGWMTSNIFSLYYLFAVQEDTFQYSVISKSHLPDLKQGWVVLDRYKDESDVEWLTWKYYLRIFWLPVTFHFLGSETLRIYNKSLLPYWYISFPLGFIFLKFGTAQVLLLVLQPLIYTFGVCVGGIGSTKVIWITSIILLVSVNSLKSSELAWQLADTDEDVYLLFISLGWTQVRCMSFSFDQIEKRQKLRTRNEKYEESFVELLKRILSYSLYFPTLLMGPIVMYSDFENSFIEMKTPIWIRLKRFLVNITLMLIYTCLMDLALHYIYFLALQIDLTWCHSLPSMALCGAGLWMGVQFHLKYVVMYGTSGAIASLDDVRAPPTPRCIARIHLYSHMWKYFDVGLYTFLIKYIYKPILTAMSGNERKSTLTNKSIASFLTFTFIFLWHGTMLSILIWSILNYAGVTLETLAAMAANTESYTRFKVKILKTSAMEERFKAFVSTPLLIMSALSNFYLFAGYNVGNIFVKRFFAESWYNVVFIYFCLYTCCNVSAALSDVPSRTARANELHKLNKN